MTVSPADLTIGAAADLIAAKQLSPIDLMEAVLARIERLDPVLKTYITLTAERAMAAAKTAERAVATGSAHGPLSGIPIGLKDVVDMAGVPTTAGSAALAGNVPDRDSTIVSRLSAAGVAIVGKHNMHELGLGVTNANPHFGVCRNPWNTHHIPGGSSGGSAAAVAAGLALGAIGGDSGASVRMPAAFNNLAGMKPTQGLISRAGVFTGTWTMDSTGPIARTVADCALILQAVAGHDPADAASSSQPVPDYWVPLGGEDLAGLTIGVPDDYFFQDVHLSVLAAVNAAIGTLEALGAQVVGVSVPSARYAVDAGAVISWAEYATSQAALLRDHADSLGNDVRALLEVASTHLATDYIAAQQARMVMIREYRAAWKIVDAIVTPTSAVPPPPIGADVMFEVAKFTRIASLTGEPALSVPCGFTSDALPIGLHLQAPRFAEGVLFRVGHAYQEATDWHRRRPPVANTDSSRRGRAAAPEAGR
jgi:aspartyl-tRNA(Asn)/glutamyl-tRNA(Gln) amidotransferase subunit A